jgi:hypothetical protein
MGAEVPILRAWPDAPAHGFLGRIGGTSAGNFAHMNLADWVGDDPTNVARNWKIARAQVPALKDFARVRQVHTSRVVEVTRANASERPEADAMVTRARGVSLGVFSADCVPILVADPRAQICAAIHAGWRGVLAGVAQAAIAAMRSLGARDENIRVAMGPAIGQCCFEVDADLADRFVREIAGAGRHRRDTRAGKAHLDLRAIVGDQLIAAGLDASNIALVGPCTKCESSQFFSRRAASGAVTGLNLSFIGFDR